MTYWPFWVSGLALAGAALLHWVLTRRLLAVSGAVTAIVDRLRFGRVDDGAPADRDETLVLLRAATVAAFGESSVAAAPAAARGAPGVVPARDAVAHALLLAGLVAGGALSSALAGTWEPVASLAGERFASLTRGGPLAAPLVLLGGGFLVGFGTRMAGGCTSGHGLCGVSRAQPGSLVATAAFFGAGVAASFALARLL